jgi:outer membrane protein
MGRSAWLIAALIVTAPAQGETLQEAYKLAHQNDPKFRAAQAESRAANTSIAQANSGYLPSIKADGATLSTRQKILSSNNPIFGTGVTTFPTYTQTLSLTQAIFRKDVLERIGQAVAVVRQAEYTVLAAEQDLMLRTATAYLTVLAAGDNLELVRAERKAYGKALEFAQEKLKSGLGTITNQYDATARFAFTQAREIEAQNKLRDAKQGMREITAAMFSNFQSLRGEFPLETPNPADEERWVAVAFEQNMALNARREAVQVAYQEIQRQRAAYFPSLNLVLTHNRNDTGSTLYGGGSNVETTEAALRLTMPIYEGGITNAVTEEAVQRHQKAQEEFEQERRAVDRATRAAYEGTLSGASLVSALKQSVIAQEGTVESKEYGFRAGLSTFMAVLDAQRDLYVAKRDYAQARYDYLINRLKLKQAAGTLSEIDVANVAEALE